MATERLQKILARGGFASRRAAEKLIEEGRVRVNGRIIRELGSKADTRSDKVEVDGIRVVAEAAVYAVLHKPRGVVTTMSDPEGRPSVKEILGPIGARVYPVGRLDFATSGVLLATNDGDFAEGLMHPKKAVPKTYVVKVHGTMEPKDLDRWREGVTLEDGITLPALASMIRYEGDKTWIELTIREGRNQQIRRMGEATGFPVMRLARVSFAGVTSEGLKPGDWRHLTREELGELKKEYGVPKRLVTPEEVDTHGRGRTKFGHAGKHAHGESKRPGREDTRRGPAREDARRGPAGREDAPRAAARGDARRPPVGGREDARRPGAEREDTRRPPSRGGTWRGAAREDTRGAPRDEGREDVRPAGRGREGASPRGREGAAPRGREGAAPRGREGAAPRGREGAAPRGREGAAPRGREGAAPRGARDGAPPPRGGRSGREGRRRTGRDDGPPPARTERGERGDAERPTGFVPRGRSGGREAPRPGASGGREGPRPAASGGWRGREAPSDAAPRPARGGPPRGGQGRPPRGEGDARGAGPRGAGAGAPSGGRRGAVRGKSRR